VIQNDFDERNVKNENLTDRRSDEPSCRLVQLDQVPDENDGGNQEQDRRYDRIDSFLKTTFKSEMQTCIPVTAPQQSETFFSP
jgi:hypothetical protein